MIARPAVKPRRQLGCAAVIAALACAVGVGLTMPWYAAEQDSRMIDGFFAARFRAAAQDRLAVPVISFNIRFVMPESREDNTFSRRAPRIAHFIANARPWLVGLQEAYASQVARLMVDLPPRFRIIGYVGNGHGATPLSDPRRKWDFQTGILYDSERLELIAHRHMWLSREPNAENSTNWGSKMARTATIAAFRVRGSDDNATVVHVNTHLDVWSEPARRGQVLVLQSLARDWAERFPDAPLFVTGDFNTANGHPPYRMLVNASTSFADAWVVCAAAATKEECDSHSFSSTFHFWTGQMANTYAGRALQFILQTLHGSGVELPHHVPRSLPELWEVLRQVSPARLWACMPSSTSRLHIDWQLFAQPLSKTNEWIPRSVFVADVRNYAYSSDHFPLVALYEKRQRGGSVRIAEVDR